MRGVIAIALVSLSLVSCKSSWTSSSDQVATELKTDSGLVVGHVMFAKQIDKTDNAPHLWMTGYVTGVGPNADHGAVIMSPKFLGCSNDHLSFDPKHSHGKPGDPGSHEGDLGNLHADGIGLISIKYEVPWLLKHFDKLKSCCLVIYEDADDPKSPNGEPKNRHGSGKLH